MRLSPHPIKRRVGAPFGHHFEARRAIPAIRISGQRSGQRGGTVILLEKKVSNSIDSIDVFKINEDAAVI